MQKTQRSTCFWVCKYRAPAEHLFSVKTALRTSELPACYSLEARHDKTERQTDNLVFNAYIARNHAA